MARRLQRELRFPSKLQKHKLETQKVLYCVAAGERHKPQGLYQSEAPRSGGKGGVGEETSSVQITVLCTTQTYIYYLPRLPHGCLILAGVKKQVFRKQP